MNLRRDRNRREPKGASGPSARSARAPVDILAEQLSLAKLARLNGDAGAYERARESAIRLTLVHRIEDEVGRYRQVLTAVSGYQEWGEDVRKLIYKRLSGAFEEGIARRASARDVIISMQRIPRAAASATMVADLRHGDGELCVKRLLFGDGRLAGDARERLDDDPARIARRLGAEDWADFVRPLLDIPCGELRPELTDAARTSLRRVLGAIAAR